MSGKRHDLEKDKKDTVENQEDLPAEVKEAPVCAEDAAAEFKDKYLRAHAELENVRKRLEKEKVEFIKFATEGLITEMLYVIDNFDRAMDHVNASQKGESIIDGIKMIQGQFHGLLEKNGVTKIDAVGKMFDPHLHEAVMHVDDDTKEDETVVEEMQAGYLINGRVLRPAVVKISRKNVKEEDKGEQVDPLNGI